MLWDHGDLGSLLLGLLRDRMDIEYSTPDLTMESWGLGSVNSIVPSDPVPVFWLQHMSTREELTDVISSISLRFLISEINLVVVVSKLITNQMTSTETPVIGNLRRRMHFVSLECAYA